MTAEPAHVDNGGDAANHVLHSLLHILLQRRAPRPDEIDSALSNSVRRLAETINAQLATTLLLDGSTGKVHANHTYAGSCLHINSTHHDGVQEELAPKDALQQVESCIGMKAIRSRRTEVLYHPTHVDSCFGRPILKAGFQVRAVVAAPLRAGDQIFGSLLVINKCDDGRTVVAFTSADVALIELLAGYIARVLLRARQPNAAPEPREQAELLARLSRCKFTCLDGVTKLDHGLLSLIGEKTLRRFQILPLARTGDKAIRAAVSNPHDYQRLSDFEAASGHRIAEKVVACESDIAAALDRAFPQLSRISSVAERVARQYQGEELAASAELAADNDENSALIVNLANRIIEDAYTQGASDIHVEPQEQKLFVRYRVDGVCRVKLQLPREAHRALTTRLKIMSDLDIAEHRLPQDGRIVFKRFSPKYDLDLRVSVAPLNHGESIVMRILDKQRSTLPLDRLGFSPYNMALYRRLITVPYGMILHCGPTGSGKSMTLYAALNEVNSPELKILTAEDPIEYTLNGINQMQMKSDIGLTFARALRCFLRQDPDVILVGEIRDLETAEIAVEAALTGHVLFSTLHTNDASSTITRLVDIGVEPFLISTTLVCVCAQRLMRRLCTCKREDRPKDEEQELLSRAQDGITARSIFRHAGCGKCDNTGYKGRTGIHELLNVNDTLREMISRNASAEELKRAARRNGMRTLFEDAMEKVKAGITSLPEALQTTIPDEVQELTPTAAKGGGTWKL